MQYKDNADINQINKFCKNLETRVHWRGLTGPYGRTPDISMSPTTRGAGDKNPTRS